MSAWMGIAIFLAEDQIIPHALILITELYLRYGCKYIRIYIEYCCFCELENGLKLGPNF